MNKILIIVVGANHSGTSAVTKLLLDNGANTGLLWEDEKLGYCKYEDALFKRWCMHRIGMPCEKPDVSSKQLSEHIKDLGNVVVMKYPKALFIMNHINGLAKFIDYQVKVVCVFRNPYINVKSAAEKTSNDTNKEFFHLATVWHQATMYQGEIYYVILERLFYDRGEMFKLLDFCGMMTVDKEVNHSGLDPSMLHNKLPPWSLFNIHGGEE